MKYHQSATRTGFPDSRSPSGLREAHEWLLSSEGLILARLFIDLRGLKYINYYGHCPRELTIFHMLI